MPPRFRLCPICQKGFGTASLSIHIPQCYEKAIKRWRLNPQGPMPVLPTICEPPRSNTKELGNSEPACGNGAVGARSLRQQPTMISEYSEDSANLHPCSRCGRKFLYDRISYHESVCKGDMKRKVFNSSKQRAIEDGYENNGYAFSSSKRKKSGKSAPTGSISQPVGAPRTRWREQHREFIDAIRAARRAEGSSKAMWGAPSVQSSQPRHSDNHMRAPPAVMRHQKGIQTRQQRESLHSGPAPLRAPVSRTAPPKRTYGNAFGGGGERFSGYPGGGGGGKILNDNTTSLGMLQAFGRA